MSANQTTEELEILNPQRWGLPNSAVEKLGEGLRTIWERFRSCFKTQTRDSSEYAWFYLRGLLTMDTERNYANIARRVIDPTDDGQNLQQFMSDSPWSGAEVFKQIQTEIKERRELQNGMLTLDERGELYYRSRALRVWTLTPDVQVRKEWLFIREELDGTFTFSLSNAPTSTSIEQLALWRCLRYFAERTDPRC